MFEPLRRRPHAAIIVVMNESGEALLIRRTETAPWMPGMWGLPGGRLDEGETAEQAALRELEEETGIKADLVSVPKALGIVGQSKSTAAFVGLVNGRPRVRFRPNEEGIMEHDEAR